MEYKPLNKGKNLDIILDIMICYVDEHIYSLNIIEYLPEKTEEKKQKSEKLEKEKKRLEKEEKKLEKEEKKLEKQNKQTIWKMYVNIKEETICREYVCTSKDPYLTYLINNYEKNLINNLLQLFQILCEHPQLFILNEAEQTWIFKLPIKPNDLDHWKEFVKKHNIQVADEYYNISVFE